jgi:hypothetical protein
MAFINKEQEKMNKSFKSLFILALLTISVKNYSSAAQTYEAVSQKEDVEFSVPANAGAAPLLALQELAYDLNNYTPEHAKTDTELKDITTNYLSSIILAEAHKIKQPAHKTNVEQTIQSTTAKLRNAGTIKQKFTARYRALTLKRHTEHDLDDESVQEAAEKRFDESVNKARENITKQLIPLPCTIL